VVEIAEKPPESTAELNEMVHFIEEAKGPGMLKLNARIKVGEL